MKASHTPGEQLRAALGAYPTPPAQVTAALLSALTMVSGMCALIPLAWIEHLRDAGADATRAMPEAGELASPHESSTIAVAMLDAAIAVRKRNQGA